MRKLYVILIISLLTNKLGYSETNDTCNINFHSDVLKNTKMKLGYYYGSKSFLKDIIQINSDGYGSYKNILHKGIYFIVLPDSSIYEIMLDEGKELIIEITTLDNQFYFTSKGNPVTEAYDTFQKTMTEMFDKADSTSTVKSNSTVKILSNYNSLSSKELKTEIINLHKHTAGLFPGSLLESYLNALIPIDISSIKNLFPQDTSGILQTLNLYHLHYLDNIDLNDERLIYTPVFNEKINYYLDKIISQQPDTIVKEIEKVYVSIENNIVRRYFLESQIERYKQLSAKAKQEYVYCKITENIYLKGQAPWEDEKRLSLLKDDIERIKPTLLNQTAPEINLPGITNQNYSLSSIQSEYTLVIFWNIECSLCSRILKDINKTVSSYNYIPVHVYSVCICDDFAKWSSFVIKGLPKTWTNTIQLMPMGPSVIYNISKTPTLLLLDSNKKIIQKNVTNVELDSILLKIALNKIQQ